MPSHGLSLKKLEQCVLVYVPEKKKKEEITSLRYIQVCCPTASYPFRKLRMGTRDLKRESSGTPKFHICNLHNTEWTHTEVEGIECTFPLPSLACLVIERL